MENHIYELIVTFESGEQNIFIDDKNILDINEKYASQMIINNELNLNREFEYFSVLIINPNLESSGENYIKFKEYSEIIIEHLEKNDPIKSIVLKDSYGDVYYNIVAENLVGVNLDGANELNNVNKLTFRLYFYLKKGE